MLRSIRHKLQNFSALTPYKQDTIRVARITALDFNALTPHDANLRALDPPFSSATDVSSSSYLVTVIKRVAIVFKLNYEFTAVYQIEAERLTAESGLERTLLKGFGIAGKIPRRRLLRAHPAHDQDSSKKEGAVAHFILRKRHPKADGHERPLLAHRRHHARATLQRMHHSMWKVGSLVTAQRFTRVLKTSQSRTDVAVMNER